MSAPPPPTPPAERFRAAWMAWNEIGAAAIDMKDAELFTWIGNELKASPAFDPHEAREVTHLLFIEYCKSVLRKDQEIALMRDPILGRPAFSTEAGVDWLATRFDQMGVARTLLPDLQECRKMAALIVLGRITFGRKKTCEV